MEDGFSALSMHMGTALEKLREHQRELNALKTWRDKTDERLATLEAQAKGSAFRRFLLELYTPKQWGMIALVAIAALWGIVTPEEARDKVRSLLSLAPSSTHAPR